MTMLLRQLCPLMAGLIAAPLLALAATPEPSSSLSDHEFKPAGSESRTAQPARIGRPTAADGLIERFEHPLPDNPDWKSFKLSRIGSRPMNDAEWEAFKAATVRRAMDLRDGE